MRHQTIPLVLVIPDIPRFPFPNISLREFQLPLSSLSWTDSIVFKIARSINHHPRWLSSLFPRASRIIRFRAGIVTSKKNLEEESNDSNQLREFILSQFPSIDPPIPEDVYCIGPGSVNHEDLYAFLRQSSPNTVSWFIPGREFPVDIPIKVLEEIPPSTIFFEKVQWLPTQHTLLTFDLILLIYSYFLL